MRSGTEGLGIRLGAYIYKYLLFNRVAGMQLGYTHVPTIPIIGSLLP